MITFQNSKYYRQLYPPPTPFPCVYILLRKLEYNCTFEERKICVVLFYIGQQLCIFWKRDAKQNGYNSRMKKQWYSRSWWKTMGLPLYLWCKEIYSCFLFLLYFQRSFANSEWQKYSLSSLPQKFHWSQSLLES